MGGIDAQNILGRILGGIAIAEGLREPGGLFRNLALRQQMLASPETRASLVGSPFQAGLLGVGGAGAPGVGPAARSLQGGGITPGTFLPNLPPLSAQSQLKQSLAEASQAVLNRGGAATREDVARRALKLHPGLAEQLAQLGINTPGTVTPSGEMVPGTSTFMPQGGGMQPTGAGPVPTLPPGGNPPLTAQDLINANPGLRFRITPEGDYAIELGPAQSTVLPPGATRLPTGTIGGRETFQAPPRALPLPTGATVGGQQPSPTNLPGYAPIQKPPASLSDAQKLLQKLDTAYGAFDDLLQPIVDPTTRKSAINPATGQPLRPIDTLVQNPYFGELPVIPGVRQRVQARSQTVTGAGAQKILSAKGQTSKVAKMFGEVGNLNEQEQARVAEAFIVNANDTPTSAARKIAYYNQTIDQTRQAVRAALAQGRNADEIRQLVGQILSAGADTLTAASVQPGTLPPSTTPPGTTSTTLPPGAGGLENLSTDQLIRMRKRAAGGR